MNYFEIKTDTDESPQPKKRQRKVENWKCVKAKTARNKGEAYISPRSNRLVRAREVGPPCKCGCFDNVGIKNVKEIFSKFWELGDYDRQNEYLSELITRVEIENTRVKGRPSRKKHENTYTVMVDNEVYDICRTAFYSIHDITERRIRTVLDKADTSCHDSRGKSESSHSARKISQERRQTAIDNINSILEIAADDDNENGKHDIGNDNANDDDKKKSQCAKSLPAGVTIDIMYDLYIEWLMENDIQIEPVSKRYYRDVFNSEFKWLKKPKKAKPKSSEQRRPVVKEQVARTPQSFGQGSQSSFWPDPDRATMVPWAGPQNGAPRPFPFPQCPPYSGFPESTEAARWHHFPHNT